MKPQRQLVTYYYQEHFLELLHFVKSTYSHILDDKQLRFILDFQNLSRNEQCLYVRMANRKGHIFHKHALLYQEIDDFALAQDGLSSKGVARRLQECDYRFWLKCLKKINCCRKLAFPSSPIGAKTKIIQLIAEQVCFSDFCQQVSSTDYLVQGKLDSINFILFLYFGKPQVLHLRQHAQILSETKILQPG